MSWSFNVQKLKVPRTSIDFLDIQDSSSFKLDHLEELEMVDFNNLAIEINIVKLVFASSHVLKKVRITLNTEVSVDEEMMMLRDFVKGLNDDNDVNKSEGYGSVRRRLVKKDERVDSFDVEAMAIVGSHVGFENRPPMLNKENYVSWSSRLLWYTKSRPNGKLTHNSIINGPYVRRMIPEPGDPNREVPVNETFHTILLGLTEDIYAVVDSCETAQEIWLRVQQMMKGSDIGIQEKKAKLFNEWERFTSTGNVGNQVIQNAAQNLRIQNIGNQNGLIVVPGNANQNPNGNDGSAEVHNYENCYDNEIFNVFTQEEQYTELLEPIPEPHQVPQNNNNVISEVSDQKDTVCGTSVNTKFTKQSILGKPPKVGEIHALSKPVTSNSTATPQESKVVKNVK
nr:hypothetical protein [Tanacetum cinerariifolium]